MRVLTMELQTSLEQQTIGREAARPDGKNLFQINPGHNEYSEYFENIPPSKVTTQSPSQSRTKYHLSVVGRGLTELLLEL